MSYHKQAHTRFHSTLGFSFPESSASMLRLGKSEGWRIRIESMVSWFLLRYRMSKLLRTKFSISSIIWPIFDMWSLSVEKGITEEACRVRVPFCLATPIDLFSMVRYNWMDVVRRYSAFLCDASGMISIRWRECQEPHASCWGFFVTSTHNTSNLSPSFHHEKTAADMAVAFPQINRTYSLIIVPSYKKNCTDWYISVYFSKRKLAVSSNARIRLLGKKPSGEAG